MRSRLPLPVLFIFLSIIVFTSSCHKKDWLNNRPTAEQNDSHLVHEFFHNSTPVDPIVQKIAAHIKERYDTSAKLPAFIKKHGLAIWNKALIFPFTHSNTTQKVDSSTDDNNYVLIPLVRLDSSYVQAALFCKITGDSIQIKLPKGAKDGLPDDQGGHLIGSRFDGAGEEINLVPMNGDLNLGGWKIMENEWASALQLGKSVKIEVRLIYSGQSLRPIGLEVDYWIDSVKTTRSYSN